MASFVTEFFNWLNYPQWVYWLIGIYLLLPTIYLIVPFIYGKRSQHPRVVICVLGDLGHSPRMCYHARSFSAKGYDVDLCGYLEELPPADIMDDEDITIHAIPTVKNTGGNYLVFIVRKVAKQLFALALLLWELRGAQYIMVQTPPGIPILLLAVLYKLLFGSKLIIDWHNLGYSILALRLGDTHLLVRLNKLYDHVLARFADINLTVTQRMKQFLVDEFGVNKSKIVVLYDKAASQFKPIVDPQEKLKVISSHGELFKNFSPSSDKIIVSSTSFTPDEDFNVLVEALVKYDTLHDDNLPKLKVIITGKGPLKEQFLKAIEAANLQKSDVQCAWLAAEEYPKILAIADIGISLHTSSSGIDLPMKVVDMFGCGVPVLALEFDALPELVDDGINGMRVLDARQIVESFIYLFLQPSNYEVIKKGAMEKSKQRWETNWKAQFGDLLHP
ncbi:chitobiosyldiphosphodolichol beta-1,4 mannosyltransferase [Cyberlindnera jadinii NRRL Y-1542]|uniref:Chitobiosyldiphosphodolichol beta-mannosyltransferase n=1 Tax=Cyberlindnera jadinii (strain ATCC 18201 / CBS 1600 / BCRC 20928 / JCM 3617 / NBRC 0987 / NRRL Y-1542) TaxID=983966 RepID=A0A1E4RU88_CYBJN|nr:UDP-Glycosyltransferase/glycogen phosphorylase [Cyberlindnera jadinii NRRL Y-1542]ODV70798.1 UDP-Glycosyltransferase/glycogen phosphorylase [Cyberlindnera jadinii NRRL Y-1542]